MHRYSEIEEFPKALNQSQMWNWSTRLFITEARQNLTAEDAAGLPSRHSHEELEALEKALKEHETWLNIGVERQKRVRMNEDPAIETAEMKKRAEELAAQLQRLVKRKIPKIKKTPASTASAPAETATGEGPTADKSPEGTPTKHDEL